MEQPSGIGVTKWVSILRAIKRGISILLWPKKYLSELRELRKVDTKAIFWLLGSLALGVTVITFIFSFAPDALRQLSAFQQAENNIRNLAVFPQNVQGLGQMIAFLAVVNIAYLISAKKTENDTLLPLVVNFNAYFFGTFFIYLCFGSSVILALNAHFGARPLTGWAIALEWILTLILFTFVYRYIQIQGWVYGISWKHSSVVFLLTSIAWRFTFVSLFQLI